MIKLKSNIEGRCPFCNSNNLQYSVAEFDEVGVKYNYTCLDCGATGDECYNLEFAGHYNVKKDNINIDCVDDAL